MPLEPISYEDGRPMLLAGLRRHHAFADAARTIAAQWDDFPVDRPEFEVYGGPDAIEIWSPIQP